MRFRERRLQALPLYFAFAATGVGVALPGVLLPVLLTQWQYGMSKVGHCC